MTNDHLLGVVHYAFRPIDYFVSFVASFIYHQGQKGFCLNSFHITIFQ